MTRRGLDWWLHKAAVMGWLLIGRNDAACAALGRMLARWPDDAYALASRAHVHAQAGRRAQAIDDAQALVQAHPDGAASNWFNLGYLLEEDGRLPEAEAAFRRALALNDQHDRAWYGLALVLIRQQRLDDAVQALERNTRLQPMSPYGWYQLARVQVDRGQPDAALKVIRHLKTFEPKVAAQLERETGLVAGDP
ncbi:MAG: tetratricopeptide repeat protein [Rubrivivax sp.]